jgi:DNA uptake protein ComE-like DNA-binding protein
MWKPGQSGNPSGHRNFGRSVLEWQNIMGEWSREELVALMKNNKAPINKVAAARAMLTLATMKETKAGIPQAQAEWGNVLDRHVGKPIETSLTHSTSEVTVTKRIDIRNATAEQVRALQKIRREIEESAGSAGSEPKEIEGPQTA